MELFGARNNRSVWSTVHTSTRNHLRGGSFQGGGVELPELDRAFHVWELSWNSRELSVSVDRTSVFRYARPATSDPTSWPFDLPHFLLLNLAVGGGPVDAIDERRFETAPVEFFVDWVRVYQPEGAFENASASSPPTEGLSTSPSDLPWYRAPLWLGVAAVGGLVLALMLCNCLRTLCKLLLSRSGEVSPETSSLSPSKQCSTNWPKASPPGTEDAVPVQTPRGAVVVEQSVGHNSIVDKIRRLSLGEQPGAYETV